MAHFNGNENDNFHFDPNSIGSDWLSGNTYQMRRLESRASKLNWDYNGAHMSTDYTRTTFDNAQGNLNNPQRQMGAGFGTDPGYFDYNPFVTGYAIAHLRANADPMFKMTEKRGTIALPRHDVMDEKEIAPDTTLTANTNYPAEGWSSFGKKYDKAQAWQGNTWINV